MKTIITAWPIDRPLQEKIGIYQNSTVESQSIGRVLGQLVAAGYTNIHSFVNNQQNALDFYGLAKNDHILCIHCKKGVQS